MAVRASSRADAIEFVANSLLNRASRLTRVLLRFGSRELSRTESGLLLTLLDGSRRITELAETEALAQPTVTQLVDRLERRGLVTRERSIDDRRVVQVSISTEGRRRLEAVQAQFRAEMRAAVADLSDAELAELVAVTETLGRLIDALQQRGHPA